MKKKQLRQLLLIILVIITFFLIFIGGNFKSFIITTRLEPLCTPFPGNPPISCNHLDSLPDHPLNYSYQVINKFPHDHSAFTQGLLYHDGYLYESTGLYGKSTLRKVSLETGNTVKEYSLPAEFFAEGLALVGNQLVQLTWMNQTAFIYDLESFSLVKTMSYSTQGWGLTYDRQYLILSDGSEKLFYFDPESFTLEKEVTVSTDYSTTVSLLNELEFVEGKIFANIWKSSLIAIIDPLSGRVVGWIDFTPLVDELDLGREEVLNGIAYDPENARLFITGKNWPFIYEIEIALTSTD